MVWFDPDLPVLRIHLTTPAPLLGLQHVATVPGYGPTSFIRECWAASVAQAFYFRPRHAVYVAVTRMYLFGGRVAE